MAPVLKDITKIKLIYNNKEPKLKNRKRSCGMVGHKGPVISVLNITFKGALTYALVTIPPQIFLSPDNFVAPVLKEITIIKSILQR